MSNLIVEAVPPSQTGVATGMNSNIRVVGAAVGSAVTTSLIVNGVIGGGLPKEHGYVLAFAACTVAMVVAGIAAFRIPTGRPRCRRARRYAVLNPEAEVVFGAWGVSQGVK